MKPGAKKKGNKKICNIFNLILVGSFIPSHEKTEMVCCGSCVILDVFERSVIRVRVRLSGVLSLNHLESGRTTPN